MKKETLFNFIAVQKRTFDAIYRRFGYKKDRIPKLIKELISEKKIILIQEHCRIGGLRMKFKIVR